MLSRLKKLLNAIANFVACKTGSHDWTCAAAEGLAPTQEQLHGGMEGFLSYARMYCKRCGYTYVPRRLK